MAFVYPIYMANLFKGLKPNTKLAKNGFSLSQKHVFSSRPGLALPCLALEVVPNDHIEIDVANLTRTMTLSTASFVRGKFNFDFFFVPYSQIWHPFNQFIDQRKDQHSTLQKGINYVPTIDLGRLLKLIWQTYQSFSGNISTDAHQASMDIFGYSWAYNALRILDMLGYGAFYEILTFDNDNEATVYFTKFNGVYVNIFRMAAYQHIWYDFYRNKYFDVDTEYRDGLSQGLDYVRYWNFDDIDCSAFGSSHPTINVDAPASSDNDRIFGLLQQRYVQYKRDLFTSVMPSTQFGAVSSLTLSNVFIESTSGDSAFGNVSADESGVLQPDNGGSSEWNVPSAFDVLQLRKAELLQRWKQLTLRAGNMVDDNFRAHYGVTSHYESDNNVMFLGSYSSDLQINPVEGTVNNSDGQIGSLGATGTAVANGSKIVFDLKDHGDYGVIMCIQSFIPENEYNALMVDKQNTMYEPFDFFTPEFQNIGLEAVTRSSYDFAKNVDKRNDLLGYAPRYYAYKTALDKVHGEFIDSPIFGLSQSPSGGSLEHWTAPRHEILSNAGGSDLKISTRNLATFYVAPSIFNNIFALEISPKNGFTQSQKNDCFVNNVYFDIKAIRPMSSLGLPEF